MTAARRVGIALTRRVGTALAPLAMAAAPVAYVHALHVALYFGGASFSPWLALLALPPLAAEVVFTRQWEARRHGWRWWVGAGLAVRLAAIGAVFWLFVWETLRRAGTPDIATPLLSLWPGVVRLAWVVSPLPSAALAAALVAAYLTLTVRWRVLRWTTTALLPGLATLALFQLFYFHPDSPLRGGGGERPAHLERVFPRGDPPAPLALPFHPRDVLVAPDDGHAVATYGRTFGDRVWNQPNLARIDLADGAARVHRFDTIRRIRSGDPDVVWFAPWHGARLFRYDVAADALTEHALPAELNGWPVEEIMAVVHVPERAVVYAANNRNPAVFAWDTRRNALRGVANLVGAGPAGVEIRLGDSVGLMARDAVHGRLYLGMFGRHELVEIDEEALAVTRTATLPAELGELRVAPDGRSLYGAAFLRSSLYVIDAATLAVTDAIDVPLNCRTGAFSSDGRWFFLASYLTGELLVIDTAERRVVARPWVGPKAEGVAVTARFVYVSTADGLYRAPRSALGTTPTALGTSPTGR